MIQAVLTIRMTTHVRHNCCICTLELALTPAGTAMAGTPKVVPACWPACLRHHYFANAVAPECLLTAAALSCLLTSMKHECLLPTVTPDCPPPDAAPDYMLPAVAPDCLLLAVVPRCLLTAAALSCLLTAVKPDLADCSET